MPFKNNGTSQKWLMKNFPPEIDKFDTHKKWCLTKMAHLVKKIIRGYMPRAEQSNF